jgi:hypothetical protein
VNVVKSEDEGRDEGNDPDIAHEHQVHNNPTPHRVPDDGFSLAGGESRTSERAAGLEPGHIFGHAGKFQHDRGDFYDAYGYYEYDEK